MKLLQLDTSEVYGYRQQRCALGGRPARRWRQWSPTGIKSSHDDPTRKIAMRCEHRAERTKAQVAFLAGMGDPLKTNGHIPLLPSPLPRHGTANCICRQVSVFREQSSTDLMPPTPVCRELMGGTFPKSSVPIVSRAGKGLSLRIRTPSCPRGTSAGNSSYGSLNTAKSHSSLSKRSLPSSVFLR